MPSGRGPMRMPACPVRPGDRADLAAGVLAVVMILALVLAEVGGRIWPRVAGLEWLAVAAAVVLALVRLGAVQRIARLFVAGAGVAIALVAALAPASLPAIGHALMQGTAFSAFLTALGLIRAPVRASHVVASAAARLFSFPARLQHAALTFGTQFISVLFNLGTIGMMADIASDHAARAAAAGQRGIDPRGATLAALRGTVLMTVWSPIGVGFAIVTSAIPGLDPVTFLGLSLAAALAVTAEVTALDRSPPIPDVVAGCEAGETPASSVTSDRALVGVLVAIVGLIAVTIVIHLALGISFLVAACIVLPLLAALWPVCEPAARGTGDTGVVEALASASRSMASESTIFLAAAVIGAGISLAAEAAGLTAFIAGGHLSGLVVILGCLVLIPIAGAAMIPHSIVMLMAAQMFGSGPVGQAHPYSLALGLCFAWAMAISSSPISAMSIITGRHLGLSPARVTFAVNRGFTLNGLMAAAVLTCVTYVLE